MSSSPSESIQESSSKTEVKLKGLPDGWRREVVIRKNGQSAGKTDVYYYSPCGKKFRSKPQIARFLGETADLTVFDFSRGALAGATSVSHRRARDRHVRRPFDGKGSPSLVKPLSSHPLGASGPIRRTCGVIKLPVVWVPEPKRKEGLALLTNSEPEPEPMDTSDSASPVPAPSQDSSDMNGSVSPLPLPDGQIEDKPKTPDQSDGQIEDKPKTPDQSVPKSQPAPSSPSPVPQAPEMADGNRSTAKSQSPSAQAPSSPTMPSPFSAPISSSSTVSTVTTTSQHVFPALWENRLRGYVVHNHETKTEIKVDLERLHNGMTPSANGGVADKNTSLGGGKGAENGTRSGSGDPKLSNSGIQLPQTMLLNNLLGKQNMITSAAGSGAISSVVPSLLAHVRAHHKQGGVASAGGVVLASGKYSKENSNVIKPGGTGLASTSQPNRNNITSGNIIFTLPTITQGAIKMIKEAAAVSSRANMKQASSTTVTGQKHTLRTSGPVITSTTSHVAANSVLQPGSADSKQNLFVSKSELVLQEERVRRLREQLLAAQGAV